MLILLRMSEVQTCTVKVQHSLTKEKTKITELVN